MASAGQVKLSREEYKKQKELEEARKAGRVAPAIDDEGNMINPHIPQVWYSATEKLYVCFGILFGLFSKLVEHGYSGVFIISRSTLQYISQAPWYLNNTAPGLKHQKAQQKKEAVGLDVWYACTMCSGPGAAITGLSLPLCRWRRKIVVEVLTLRTLKAGLSFYTCSYRRFMVWCHILQFICPPHMRKTGDREMPILVLLQTVK
jgi:hypothetical protein